MLIVVKNLRIVMIWLKSTNAKEIGTLYLIFAVFAVFAEAFSVLIILDLFSPSILFLEGEVKLQMLNFIVFLQREHSLALNIFV